MRELALFAGAGGGLLGGELLGWRTVCAVEIDAYCRQVLLARQRDGALGRFPIWDDVATFDGQDWFGSVDVVSGGFPCQDISAAGKGAGIGGQRSGLWAHMARIIGEVRPRYVLVENSPMLVSRGLDVVLADLATLGFDARWGVIGAHHVGAPHRRDRLWIAASHPERQQLRDESRRRSGESREGAPQPGDDGTSRHVAHPDSFRPQGESGRIPRGRQARQAEPGEGGQDVANAKGDGDSHRHKRPGRGRTNKRSDGQEGEGWWSTEPNVGRVAHGVASRVVRLKAIGNGQVPAVAALAWETLSRCP